MPPESPILMEKDQFLPNVEPNIPRLFVYRQSKFWRATKISDVETGRRNAQDLRQELPHLFAGGHLTKRWVHFTKPVKQVFDHQGENTGSYFKSRGVLISSHKLLLITPTGARINLFRNSCAPIR